MRTVEEAGGVKELAKSSMSSRNFAAGMSREFVPSVMESSLMSTSADPFSGVVDMIVPRVLRVLIAGCFRLFRRRIFAEIRDEQ